MQIREKLISKLTSGITTIDEFNFDQLMAPPLLSLLSPYDLDGLYNIATSVRYSGNPAKKYKAIDNILTPRGFQKLVGGTNRICYKFLEDSSFVIKVATDAVGIQDTPKEYENQRKLKPFVTKVFEYSPGGAVGLFERVVGVTSREQFASIAPDVYDLINCFILQRGYIMADIGSHFFMNYGVRVNFGPVLLDFPYLFELDGAKLKCHAPNPMEEFGFCGGEIDFDDGFNSLSCTKCGLQYRVRDLSKKIDAKEIIVGERSKHKMKVSYSIKGTTVRPDDDTFKQATATVQKGAKKQQREGGMKVTAGYRAPRKQEDHIVRADQTMNRGVVREGSMKVTTTGGRAPQPQIIKAEAECKCEEYKKQIEELQGELLEKINQLNDIELKYSTTSSDLDAANEEIKKLETSASVLRDELASVSDKRDALQEELDKLNTIQPDDPEAEDESVTRLQEQVDQLNKEIEELNAAIKDKDDAIMEKDVIIEQKNEIIENLDTDGDYRVHELEVVLKEKDDEIQKKDEQIDQKNEEMNNLIMEKEAAIEELNKVIKDKDDAIMEKDSIIQEKDAIIEKLDTEQDDPAAEAEAEKLRGEIADLKERLTEAQDNLAKEQAKAEEAAKLCETAQQDLELVNAKVSTLESELAANSGVDTSAYEAKISELEEAVQEAKASAADKENKLMATENKIVEYEQKLKETVEKAKEQVNIAADARALQEAAEEKLGNMQSTVEAIEAENKQLTADKAELEKKIAEAAKGGAPDPAQFNDLKDKIKEQEEQIKDLTMALGDKIGIDPVAFEKELNEAREAAEKAKAEVLAAADELNEEKKRTQQVQDDCNDEIDALVKKHDDEVKKLKKEIKDLKDAAKKGGSKKGSTKEPKLRTSADLNWEKIYGEYSGLHLMRALMVKADDAVDGLSEDNKFNLLCIIDDNNEFVTDEQGNVIASILLGDVVAHDLGIETVEVTAAEVDDSTGEESESAAEEK